MRSTLATAIIEAYDDIKHNIPEDAPDSTACPLLVKFNLGDIRAFVRGVKSMRENAKLATGG